MAVFYRGLGAKEICCKGDKSCAEGDLEQATALYTHAFGCNAGNTMAHMRNLNKTYFKKVILTLETWLDGYETTPNSLQGLNKGLGAVFLSTLCPNNVSASVFKMDSILQGAVNGSDEIFARCSAFLEDKRKPCLEGPTRLILELTTALACLLSDLDNAKGPQLYLQAFIRNESETVRLVKSRHSDHFPRIVGAFFKQIAPKFPAVYAEYKSDEILNSKNKKVELSASESINFLVALSPENTLVRELQGAVLLSSGLFDESAEAFSLALNLEKTLKCSKTKADMTKHEISQERKASLLISRSAAYFSKSGRASEACRDLAEGFGLHPAVARHQFQKLFSENGIDKIVCMELQQQAERGISSYRDTVLLRSDLRSCEGVELLDPVIFQLRALCHIEPDGGGRALRVRLADCLLLRGKFKEALSMSSQLAAALPTQQSYQNTVQVLRGFARFFSEDQQGALEDFQAVIEHSVPHPSSCVRALCGRGLLRLMAGSHYLTALDYMTASQLQHQETALTVRCLIPWNCRGLLCTVLLEQGRAILEEYEKKRSSSVTDIVHDHQQSRCVVSTQNEGYQSMMSKEAYTVNKEGMAVGVHVLALLLMELQPGTDAPQILAADALYQLDRVEDAYRLLLSMEHVESPRSSVLARLVLLQLHKGFLYDANQLLKKLIHCGDTSGISSLLSVAPQKDRALLEKHCHSASKRILCRQKEEHDIKEAITYLSIAIMASGGEAVDSLLERGRCYALLGQRKTAIFDFTVILKEHPDHVQALCGRGFTYLMLNQQKDCTQDILAALKVDAEAVTQCILSLKDKAQKLICEWLHQHCCSILSTNAQSYRKEYLHEAFLINRVLIKTDSKDPRWHLLYTDTLLAQGNFKAAEEHLQQVFGQESRQTMVQPRWGVVESWKQNYSLAAKLFSRVSEKEPAVLKLLLTFIQPRQRKLVAQAAFQEASRISKSGHWEHVLSLLTVAVQAYNGTNLQHLRQRAVCLVKLGLHERAVSDLDQVILIHSKYNCEEFEVRAEDLCRRGHSLLMCSQDEMALRDFSQALDLHMEHTLVCVDAGPGTHRLADLFSRFAMQSFGENQLDKAWNLVHSGLRVDHNHIELRQLKARIKREVSGPCNIN